MTVSVKNIAGGGGGGCDVGRGREAEGGGGGGDGGGGCYQVYKWTLAPRWYNGIMVTTGVILNLLGNTSK